MLLAYRENGAKRFACGQIKIIKRYSYNPLTALQWVHERGMKELLRLDTKGFERILSALDDKVPNFVSIENEPKAYLNQK